MKALVTGITGFAGGHLAAHLLAQGDQVLGTSRRAGVCTLAAWHLLPPGKLAGEIQESGGGHPRAVLESLGKAASELAQAQAKFAGVNPEIDERLKRIAQVVAGVADRIGGIQLPEDSQPTIPLIAWNITDPAPADVVAEISRFAPDAIYHLAAESIPAHCGDGEPTPAAWAANVGSVSNVLALAESLPRRPRVLIISSSQVYAPLSAPPTPLGEDHPLAPARGYGRTKLAAEREALRAASGGLEVVIARAFNHSGPGQWPPLMLPEWCEQLANPESPDAPLQIKTADGWLDLSDVRDVVRAYRLLIELGASGGIYNVGAGRALRTGDILAQLLAVSGSKREIIESQPRTMYGHVADTARLFQATGWQPMIPFEDTLADTLAWWRTGPRPSTHASSSSEPKDSAR